MGAGLYFKVKLTTIVNIFKWQCSLVVWLPGVPHPWRGGEAWGRNTRNQFRIPPAASHRNPGSSSVSSAAHGAGDWADSAAVCPRGSWKKEFRSWTGLQGMEMVNSNFQTKQGLPCTDGKQFNVCSNLCLEVLAENP